MYAFCFCFFGVNSFFFEKLAKYDLEYTFS